jgi:hypothetical protein
MAPKSKRTEGEENPFLPPPVDLDRIPLADKDYLIADTKCNFNFADLQSWLKEVFLAFSLNDNEMDRDLDAGSHDSSLEIDEIDERLEQSIQLFDVHDQDDYMDSFPKQPNTSPTIGQIIFQLVMEKNQFAAYNFIIANQEDSESDEGYTLPLCFE